MFLLILWHWVWISIRLHTNCWWSKFLSHIFHQFLFDWLIDIIWNWFLFMYVGFFLEIQILKFIKFMTNWIVIRILSRMDISLRILLLLFSDSIWCWKISFDCHPIAVVSLIMLWINIVFRESICLDKSSTILTRKWLSVIYVEICIILIKLEFPHHILHLFLQKWILSYNCCLMIQLVFIYELIDNGHKIFLIGFGLI